MAREKEIKVTYSIINKQFNKAIAEINSEVKKLNKEFNLQKEQMKLTSSESAKLEASLRNLNSKYELAQKKTEEIKNALESSKKLMGENSEEAKKWGLKLLDAQKNEESLKNAIEQTNKKLAEAIRAESESAKASEARKNSLKSLASAQESLKNSSEKLTKEYELQVKSLGNNASESDKLKLRQEYLKKALENSAKEVANLERQLEISKSEYGENSKEVDRLEKELLEAKTAAKDFENEYKNVGSTVKRVSDNISAAGKSLSGFGDAYSRRVSVPLALGMAGTIKHAADLEQAFTGVKKTIDEVYDKNGNLVLSYDDLEKQLYDLGRELPISNAEIMRTAEVAGQLGIKGTDIKDFTRTMLQMGIATNMSSDEAATALSRFMNIAGAKTSDVDKLGSVIVKLGNSFATDEKSVMDMTLRLAGMGKQLNMSLPDVVAMATAMSSMGIEAEAGGTAMSMILNKMEQLVDTG